MAEGGKTIAVLVLRPVEDHFAELLEEVFARHSKKVMVLVHCITLAQILSSRPDAIIVISPGEGLQERDVANLQLLPQGVPILLLSFWQSYDEDALALAGIIASVMELPPAHVFDIADAVNAFFVRS